MARVEVARAAALAPVRAAALALVLAALVPRGAPAAPPTRPVLPTPIPAQFDDASYVERSLRDAPRLELGGARVTGITVPHHLLAADLIAAAFRAAAVGARPDRIVILAPDHFKRAARAFATTRSDFATVLGPVAVDRRAVDRLLAAPEVEASWLFKQEHGIGALLPYVRRFFPGVPIVPVAIAIRARQPAWDTLVARLRPLVTPRTLIVQSTDFSHYLGADEATAHDRQTLAALAAADLGALARLHQPRHLDSLGAQYVQTRLQRDVFAAETVVFAHRNSAHYAPVGSGGSTSYIAMLHVTGAESRVLVPDPGLAERTVCFAGDAFFGRYVATLLARPAVEARVRRALTARLRGCPLVVNLEGVLVDGPLPPPGAIATASGPLVMPAAESLAWLRALGVRAVGVANNHSRDRGDAAYAAMVGMLRASGVVVLESGRAEPVGPVDVVALTDLDNAASPRSGLLGDADLGAVAGGNGRPRIAFVHWGREFVAEPGPRERELAAGLERAGAALVVGAHPHRASRRIERLGERGALLAYSLGNFVFDQHGPLVSGAILQVTAFASGALFVRQIALPPLRELAAGAGSLRR